MSLSMNRLAVSSAHALSEHGREALRLRPILVRVRRAFELEPSDLVHAAGGDGVAVDRMKMKYRACKHARSSWSIELTFHFQECACPPTALHSCCSAWPSRRWHAPPLCPAAWHRGHGTRHKWEPVSFSAGSSTDSAITNF